MTRSGKKTIVDEELLLEDKELSTLFEPLSKELLPLLELGETLQKATGGMKFEINSSKAAQCDEDEY